MSDVVADDRMDRKRCSAMSKQTGEQCGNSPARGQAVCRFHGGGSPQAKKAAARRLAAAAGEAAVRKFGLDVSVHPGDALLSEVSRSAALVVWLGDQLAGMGDEDVTVSPEWQAWMQERQHLARVSKAALDAGVDERRVQLAESQAETLADVIRAVLDGLGLSAEQRAMAINIVKTRLTAISAQ
jgi:uncharacterized protein YgfB (UPF0149 family)